MKKKYIKLSDFEKLELERYKILDSIKFEEAKQIEAILMFNEGKTVIVTSEEIGASFQTLKKWRVDFDEYRLDSIPSFKLHNKNTDQEEE